MNMPRSWRDLPKELRIRVLEFSHLVRRWDWTWADRDGANVLDGRLMFPEEHDNVCTHTPASGICNCTIGYWIPFPVALFRVSRQMRDEAREVFYSRNRFVVMGDLVESSYFFSNLPTDAAHLIRKVDIKLSFDQVWDLGDPGSITFMQWKLLVKVIQDRLQLDKLWLSVDAGSIRSELINVGNDGDHDYTWLRTAYYQIFGPMRRLKGLRKFHVFLCWALDYEAKAEKEIMGLEYDSQVEGKRSYTSRDVTSPHIPDLKDGGSRPMLDSQLWTLRMIDQLSDRDT